MAKRARRRQPSRLPTANCSFCGDSLDQPGSLLYGEPIRSESFAAHYFCMLFSSGLNQNGDPDGDPLRGFVAEEVEQELKRGTKLSCCYCKRRGATIGCSRKQCSKTFHMPCGRRKQCLFQYFDEFGAWCTIHRPWQNIVPLQTDRAACVICTNPLDPNPSHQVILTPCCRQPLHRECVQKQAESAGCHFFKCVYCANKESFQEEMLICGIYIPDRDATWELEPNAFSDLLYQYKHCDAPRCKCPHGQEHSENDHPQWEVIRCQTCGSKGVHIACGNLSRDSAGNHHWVCPDCRAVFAAKSSKRSSDLLARPQREKNMPQTRSTTRSQTPASKKRPIDEQLHKDVTYGASVKEGEKKLSDKVCTSPAAACGQSSAKDSSTDGSSHTDRRQMRSLNSSSECTRPAQKSDKPCAMVQPRIVEVLSPAASSQREPKAPCLNPYRMLDFSNVAEPHAASRDREGASILGASPTATVSARKKKKLRTGDEPQTTDRKDAFMELRTQKTPPIRTVSKKQSTQPVRKSSTWVQLSIVNFVRKLTQSTS